MSNLTYFKKNVENFNVGVRANATDTKGAILTNLNPYFAVSEEDLRDFKFANKRAIVKGLIIESKEPTTDWDTSNAISDESAVELVKTFMGLKNELPKITSVETVRKLLNAAEDRPIKTKKLIEARLAELEGDPEEENFATKEYVR